MTKPVNQPTYVLNGPQQQPVYVVDGQQPQPGVQYVYVNQQQQLPPNEETYFIPPRTEEFNIIREGEPVMCCGETKPARVVYMAKAFALFAVNFVVASIICAIFTYTPLIIIYESYPVFLFLLFGTIMFLLIALIFRHVFPLNIILLTIFSPFFGVTIGGLVFNGERFFLFVAITCAIYAGVMCAAYLFMKKEPSFLFTLLIGCAVIAAVFLIYFFVRINYFEGWLFVAVAFAFILVFCMIGFSQEKLPQQQKQF